MDMPASRTSESQQTTKHTEQPREPEFRLLVGLVLLVLAAGLIGGGWYGHSRIVETRAFTEKLVPAVPATTHVRFLAE